MVMERALGTAMGQAHVEGVCLGLNSIEVACGEPVEDWDAIESDTSPSVDAASFVIVGGPGVHVALLCDVDLAKSGFSCRGTVEGAGLVVELASDIGVPDRLPSDGCLLRVVRDARCSVAVTWQSIALDLDQNSAAIISASDAQLIVVFATCDI